MTSSWVALPRIPLTQARYAASHVWEWFWTLSSQRGSGFGSAQALSWSEIADWAKLTRTLVTPEEVKMLVAMDMAYRSTASDEESAKREKQKNERPA